jgi:lysophospholipase L1-like esterase
MAYNKQNFESGQILTATHLNNMEKGITINERYHGLKYKKISFLGDSITTFQGWIPEGYAYYYPRYGITDVEQTWWKQLINVTGMELVKNCAWSGSKITGNAASTTSAAAGCSTKRINDLADGNKVPDIIIILISINDFGADVPLGTWDGGLLPEDSTNVGNVSEAYALMVSKILKTYPHAEVFCGTVLETPLHNYDSTTNQYPSDFGTIGQAGYTRVHDYNETIRKIARAFGVNVLEMHQCGIHYFNSSSYLGDGLHPNPAGAKLMAKKALAELESKSRYCHLLEGEKVMEPEPEVGTWYVDVASQSSLNATSTTSACSFVYSDATVNNAYADQPINVLRMAVAQAGTFTYGKVSSTTYETLGTIELVNPSKELQIYEIPEVTLTTGEKMWFQASGDTGLFYYQASTSEVGDFLANIKSSTSTGSANDKNLSVDIGYFTEDDFNIYEEWLNQ